MGNAWTADNAPRYSPLSEQVEKISKSFRSLRHEKTLVVFTTFDPWRARQARLPPTNVGLVYRHEWADALLGAVYIRRIIV